MVLEAEICPTGEDVLKVNGVQPLVFIVIDIAKGGLKLSISEGFVVMGREGDVCIVMPNRCSVRHSRFSLSGGLA